jgi:hypothetical protein
LAVSEQPQRHISNERPESEPFATNDHIGERRVAATPDLEMKGGHDSLPRNLDWLPAIAAPSKPATPDTAWRADGATVKPSRDVPPTAARTLVAHPVDQGPKIQVETEWPSLAMLPMRLMARRL